MSVPLLLLALLTASEPTDAGPDPTDGGIATLEPAPTPGLEPTTPQPTGPDGGQPPPLEEGFSTTVKAERPIRSASEFEVERAVLEAAPTQGAVDLLRRVPGLVASQHGGMGKAPQLFLRGFDAVHGQDVELSFGGLPMNDVSHLHAQGYADSHPLIPEVVRRIEVTEGTGRAWQGDFAVAGTIRFDFGLEQPGLFANGRIGSYGDRRLVVGARHPEEAETFLAAEVAQGDGFGPNRAFGRATAIGQLATPLSLGSLGEGRLRLLAASYATRFDSPGVVRLDALQAGRVGLFDSALGGQGGSVTRHQALAELALAPTPHGKSSLSLGFISAEQRLRDNFTGFRNDPRGDGVEQTHEALTLLLEARHAERLTALTLPLLVELGAGARHDRIHQTQTGWRQVDGTFTDPAIDAQVRQTDGFTWAEASTTPGPWRLMLGGRLDALHVDVRDELAFQNPRFTDGRGLARTAFGIHPGLKAQASRRLGEAWELFLGYGDGFRSPVARSLSQGERAPFVNLRSGELGARAAWQRVTLQTAAFASHVSDDLFFDPVRNTTSNVGPTLRAGLQGWVSASPWQGSTLAISATAARAQVTTTGNLLPYFAPLVARADVGQAWPFRVSGESLEVRVGTGLTFIGPRPLPFDEQSLPVFLADAQLGLRWRALGLHLECTNVLDTAWRDGEFVYASQFESGGQPQQLPARHLTAGAPRRLFLTLELHP